MNSRTWMLATLALGVVAVWWFVKVPWITGASAVAAAAVAFHMLRRQGGAATPAAQLEGPADDGIAEWIHDLQSLVALNLTIREHALPDEVVSKLEENIDVLRRILPELNENHAGSELTWTVNRMAKDYLPRVVNPYVALSPAVRAEHQAELERSLVGLESELENIAGLVRSAKVGDFQSKAAFLRARFLDATSGSASPGSA